MYGNSFNNAGTPSQQQYHQYQHQLAITTKFTDFRLKSSTISKKPKVNLIRFSKPVDLNKLYPPPTKLCHWDLNVLHSPQATAALPTIIMQVRAAVVLLVIKVKGRVVQPLEPIYLKSLLMEVLSEISKYCSRNALSRSFWSQRRAGGRQAMNFELG
ncbi:3540_t:CDS:1 [Ambispora leptoticha]|uniref:3540_t:CDS:1 n=1 Tax=Ambispora leptoticha TaxID=144679 RepID=A0A9N9GM21_9GLOM|nr:3540_t:CDS:1 [Ambispora leptoticha]